MEQSESKVVRQEVLWEGKWLGMKHIDYSIGDRIKKNYEGIFRPSSVQKKLPVDCVDVIPIIHYKDKPSQLLLIGDFRPPIDSYCLEFPTGMAEDTNYEQNAMRELLQQTGYVAKKIAKTPSPAIYCDPWKSNETSYIYVAEIDGDDKNSHKGQQLQETQNIHVHKFIINEDLMNNIDHFLKTNHYHVEAKVISFCMGSMMKLQWKKIVE